MNFPRPRPRGKPSGLPAWLVGASVAQWVQIAGTTHMGSPADPTDTGNDTSRSSKRTAYCNIATDGGSKIILAATGGHSDYGGNETTAIDIGVDAPTWALLNARSASLTQDVAYQTDGKPTARHTYWSVHYNALEQRLRLHRCRAAYGAALSFNVSDGFNLLTNTWDAAGTWSDPPSVLPMCQDSFGNVWGVVNTFELWKWSAATDTWARTNTGGNFANAIWPTSAWDSSRNQMFALNWGDGQASVSGVTAYVYNAAGTTQTAITLNSIGGALAQFTTDAGSYASMVYDPIADAFFWWDGSSGRLYKITPNGSTTWDIAIVSTTGSVPPARDGSFGRMAYIPSLKGLVFMPSGYRNLYFMRTA